MTNSKKRKGFSLLEVTVALWLASTGMILTYRSISEGIILKKKAADLSNAVQLAKIKMAQIDSSTKLETDFVKGDIPGYRGYKFETEVKEEELNLLELAGGGKDKNKKSKPPADLLGSEGTGISSILAKRGKAQGSETGGIIKVFRVKVKIMYPSGFGEDSFTAETFKASKF